MQIFTIKNRSNIECLTLKSHDDYAIIMATKFNTNDTKRGFYITAKAPSSKNNLNLRTMNTKNINYC